MNLTVHFMQYGHTACMMAGVPKDWAAGHRWSGDWNDVTCQECLQGREPIETFIISPDGGSITCKRCGRTSFSHGDVEHRYCAYCNVSHEDLWPPARRWWIETVEPDMTRLECQCGWRFAIKRNDLKEFKIIASQYYPCRKCGADLTSKIKELK